MWGSSFKWLYVLVMHESTCNLQGPGNTPMGEAGLGQLYQKISKVRAGGSMTKAVFRVGLRD